MKLLIIGSAAANTLESFYRKALNDLGFSVEIFPIRDLWRKKVYNNLFSRVGQRVVPGMYAAGLNHELLSLAKDRSFDMILVFKGMELMPDTVMALKNSTGTLVMYNPDHPFLYSGRGSGNNWMKESVNHYDLYLTYTEEIKQELLSKGVRSEVVPFGYHLPESFLQGMTDSDEVNQVCFIGGGDPGRTEFLNRLSKAGLPIVVYGDGWKRGLENAIEKRPAVWGEDFWLTLRRFKVQLNIMRPHNLNSHNMRTFEIPAIGGVELAPRTTDHESFFRDGQEILLYENVEDCIDTCLSVLSSPDRLSDLREAARMRVVTSGYSYLDRAKLMMEHVKLAMA